MRTLDCISHAEAAFAILGSMGTTETCDQAPLLDIATLGNHSHRHTTRDVFQDVLQVGLEYALGSPQVRTSDFDTRPRV